jgi:hypothetical protein
MKMIILPAGAGWQWFTQSISLFSRYPLQTTLTIFVVIVGQFILSLIPLVSILTSLLGPLLVAAIMTLWRDLERGKSLSTEAFSQPFKESFAPLLGFAAIYMVSVFVIVLIVGVMMLLLMGSDLLSLLRHPDDFTMTIDIALKFFLGMLVFLFLLVPVLMAYWFAPLLIAWHRIPVGKAILFSFVASLKNWRAFLVNGLVVMGFSLVFCSIISVFLVLFMLLLPQHVAQFLFFLLFFVFYLAMITIGFINFYYSNIGVFPEDTEVEVRS